MTSSVPEVSEDDPPCGGPEGGGWSVPLSAPALDLVSVPDPVTWSGVVSSEASPPALSWERAGVSGAFGWTGVTGVMGWLALLGTFPWDRLSFGVFGVLAWFGALGLFGTAGETRAGAS